MSTVLRTKSSRGASITDGVTVLAFDATLSEDVKDKGKLTDHNVEEGFDVSDHYRNEPTEVSMEVVMTSTPLTGGTPDLNRDVQQWETLRRIKEAGEPLTLSTRVRTYTNMVITSISVGRSTEQAITATVEFREVRFATRETVEIPASAVGNRGKAGAGSRKDKGKQQAQDTGSGDTEATAAEERAEEEDSSTLHNLFG